jgi:queuine tRNA-ribosyltransferase
MGHGSVAEEIKRNRDRNRSMVISIQEEGVRFRSYADGRERFMGPETSMEVQAALGSDIALAFDECTPFHVEREYTESSMHRTHRWLDRCVEWCRDHAPAGQLLYGIVQGGVYEDLRAESSAYIAGAGVHDRVVARRPTRGAAAAPARDRRRGRHRPRRGRRD